MASSNIIGERFNIITSELESHPVSAPLVKTGSLKLIVMSSGMPMSVIFSVMGTEYNQVSAQICVI